MRECGKKTRGDTVAWTQEQMVTWARWMMDNQWEVTTWHGQISWPRIWRGKILQNVKFEFFQMHKDEGPAQQIWNGHLAEKRERKWFKISFSIVSTLRLWNGKNWNIYYVHIVQTIWTFLIFSILLVLFYAEARFWERSQGQHFCPKYKVLYTVGIGRKWTFHFQDQILCTC